jgi:ribosomal protein L36
MLNPEKYLSIDTPFCVKRSLSRLRCSSHKLYIETGRHLGIPRYEPFCQHCKIIKDEFHVFFICNKFFQQRQSYISPWYSNVCTFHNFCNLIKTKNEEKIKNIAYFCS